MLGIQIHCPDGAIGTCECEQEGQFIVSIHKQSTILCTDCIAKLGIEVINALK